MVYQEERGLIYLGVGWTLTCLLLLAFTIRIYSRSFLTRSIGSDDFAIIIAVILSVIGEAGDTMAVQHDYGRHQDQVTPQQYSQIEKWLERDWITVFINFCFVRASILLFVLRLLPVYKRWQQKFIVVTFGLNIAIALIGAVSFGLACIPYEAYYENVPGAKCFSKNKLVVTNLVNGILSCLIDITTAIIPQVLLWRVQMKYSTKMCLNVLFGLGLITAALSIGRVASMNRGAEEIDTTWRTMPGSTWPMVEEKFGILVACGPAIRQFFAYRKRTGSFLPTPRRQRVDEDFVKMRRRINIRDIIWYRKPPMREGRVFEPRPIFQPRNSDDIEATAHTSVLSEWQGNVRKKLSSGTESSPSSPHKRSSLYERLRMRLHRPAFATALYSSDDTMTIPQKSTHEAEYVPSSSQKNRRISAKYHDWGLTRKSTNNDNSKSRQLPASTNDSASARASSDHELAHTLANPVTAPSTAQEDQAAIPTVREDPTCLRNSATMGDPASDVAPSARPRDAGHEQAPH